MNRLIIPIIVVVIVAAGIGAYFVFQKTAPQPVTTTPPETPTDKCGDNICDDVEKANPSACPEDCQQTTPSPTQTPSSAFSKLSLLKKIEISGAAARPEIITTEDRVFVVYLEFLTSSRSFKIKIYDKDMTKEIVSKTLVSGSSQYGNPTDIRVVSDGEYLYAFYETADFASDKTYLFGAKYTLNDVFERVAYTGVIATGKPFMVSQPGDEKLDDTPSVVEGNNIYVMTRYDAVLTKDGYTKYKLYKFDKNLDKQSEFDLDLSDYADGEAQQSSIIYDSGYYYIVLPTTVGASNNMIEAVGWTAPSDILMVKLDKNWNVVASKIIADKEGYTEGYVTGFKSDDKYFYITYIQLILNKGMTSVIKIYDKNWNAILTEEYVTGNNLRPSIEITSNRIYVGDQMPSATIGIGQGPKTAEIYIFEKK